MVSILVTSIVLVNELADVKTKLRMQVFRSTKPIYLYNENTPIYT